MQVKIGGSDEPTLVWLLSQDDEGVLWIHSNGWRTAIPASLHLSMQHVVTR